MRVVVWMNMTALTTDGTLNTVLICSIYIRFNIPKLRHKDKARYTVWKNTTLEKFINL